MKSLPAVLGAGLLLCLTGSLASCNLLGMGLAAAGMAAEVALGAGSAKLAFKCLPEGTCIDTPEGPVPVEQLEPGDVVIGFSGKPVVIRRHQSYPEDPESERFLALEFANGARVTLCDMHRITGTHAMNIETGDMVAGTQVVSREAFSGVTRSYDILTEDEGYRIGGIPVNSMILEMEQAAREMDWFGEAPR